MSNNTDTVDNAADVAARVAAEVAAEVVQQTERAEMALNQIRLRFGLLGATCGMTIGAAVAFTVGYHKAEMKYRRIANETNSEKS